MEAMCTTRKDLVMAAVKPHTHMQYYNVQSATGGKKTRKKTFTLPNFAN